jgi:AcrR family transcriptional regulator
MPMSRKPRPGGRSAEIRLRALRAVLEELVEGGYPDLSLDGVARRAGVHKTTLYRRWRTRERLLLEALLEFSSQAVPIPNTGSLREDLLRFLEAVVINITTPEAQAILRALIAEAGRGGAFAEAAREFWAATFTLARDIVQRGIDRGELPEGTDVDLFLETLIGPVITRGLVTGEPLDRAYANRVVDLLLSARR